MGSPKIDTVKPEGGWEFGEEVAACFDDMLARSIPQYDVMRSTCFDVGRRFVKPATDVVDLGCSRGAALEPFVKEFGAYNRYVGIEISDPMADAASEKYRGLIATGVAQIRREDLRHVYPPVKASLTLAVLTLQFVPIEYRTRIVRKTFLTTVPGGAMIVVEKVLGRTADIDAMMVENYYAAKAANGYTTDDIERKKHSLEGVLVPVTADWNEDLLSRAGFAEIECFWRWMNFAAWVAIKA